MDTKKKILVIEDVHYLRNDVMEMLRFEGYDVAGAENGMIGIDLALQYKPDLIICDIMMPGLLGYDVLEELRKHPETDTTPFIFLTAKTDRVDVRHGMGLGADDYITKPFYTNELLETVRARIEKSERINTRIHEGIEEAMGDLRENITTALPHELRTPLNTIIGYSDFIIADHQSINPQDLLEWATFINEAGLRLYHLVENYLAFVRAETILRNPAYQRQSRTKTTYNVDSLLQFTLQNSAQRKGREADLELDIAPLSPVAVEEGDLTKIVQELVDNACKFSEPGTPIRVHASEDGDQLVFAITDHGRGMTEEQIQSIGAFMQFERFVYEQQGAGLGLVICRRLAQIYDGSLDITSQPGTSTTVTVRLPLRRVGESSNNHHGNLDNPVVT